MGDFLENALLGMEAVGAVGVGEEATLRSRRVWLSELWFFSYESSMDCVWYLHTVVNKRAHRPV